MGHELFRNVLNEAPVSKAEAFVKSNDWSDEYVRSEIIQIWNIITDYNGIQHTHRDIIFLSGTAIYLSLGLFIFYIKILHTRRPCLGVKNRTFHQTLCHVFYVEI